MNKLESLLKGSYNSHILPFLWMKGEDNDTILDEIKHISECGIKEICLESRPHPDFCGEQWWNSLDVIIPEAEKRDMKVWILDDDKFPTGHARGAYAQKHPELKKWYLGERHVDIMGPCRNGAILAENFIPADGRLLGIIAAAKPDTDTLAVSGNEIINLTDTLENGFVYFNLPAGAYRLFVFFVTQTGGGRADYINLVDRESVRVLIDEVYETHYKRYGRYFGTTVAGFFSDEPELGNVPGYPFDDTIGKRDQRLPWSNELESILKNKWKEEFINNLPALWYEMGERTVRVRSQYMETMTGLVYECFSGQIGEWCRTHGVRYIGHVIEDDNAHSRMGCGVGHYFKEMKGQHMSGIDVVHHQIVPGFTGKIHQWIAGDADGEFFHFALGKMGSSAAHIDPDKHGQALCEIFGNYGWAEGVSFMKWLSNHMLVRGINEFTPHAFSMTYPDRDCPPHFYARGNNPQFPAFRMLMKYLNRAADFLSSGEVITEAAVLYHAEAEWSGGSTMFFQKPVRELMEHQIDCDIIPSDCFEKINVDDNDRERQMKAVIDDKKLIINNRCYNVLIIPYAEYIEHRTAEFAVEAAKKGLPVIVIDKLPKADTYGNEISREFAAAVKVTELKNLSDEIKRICVPSVRAAAYEPDLRSISVRSEKAMSYMFFNESVYKKINTEIALKNETAVWIYDPWMNKAELRKLEKPGTIDLMLEPGEAVFIYADEECKEQPVTWKKCVSSEPIRSDWTVTRADEKHYGQFENPVIISSSDNMPNLNGRGYWPDFTGFYRYETEFETEVSDDSTYMLFIPEASDTVQVWINGTDMGIVAGFPNRINITEALKNGKNSITIECCTTLVWKRKDGASTHLQVQAVGITKAPQIESWR